MRPFTRKMQKNPFCAMLESCEKKDAVPKSGRRLPNEPGTSKHSTVAAGTKEMESSRACNNQLRRGNAASFGTKLREGGRSRGPGVAREGRQSRGVRCHSVPRPAGSNKAGGGTAEAGGGSEAGDGRRHRRRRRHRGKRQHRGRPRARPRPAVTALAALGSPAGASAWEGSRIGRRRELRCLCASSWSRGGGV